MKIYVLTEVWGTGIDEVSVSTYANRAAGRAALKSCVEQWLDGSSRDIPAVVERALTVEQFTHSDGFMRLTEEELQS